MAKNKYPHFNPERYKLDVKIASVKRSFHVKYNVNYHIIWIPKYRKPILKDRVAEVLKEIIEGQCKSYGWEKLALEIMPDHIHLFISAKPSWQPSRIVNLLKGNTSRQLRLCFPELHYLGYKKKWKKFSSLWATGYFIGTAGHVSQEQVIRYIMEQDGNSTFNYNTLKKPMGAKVKAINKLSGDGHNAPTSPLHNQKQIGDFNS